MNKNDIKKIRVALRLTQEKFAQKLKVSVATVGLWETGRFSPSPLALEKLLRLQKRLQR